MIFVEATYSLAFQNTILFMIDAGDLGLRAIRRDRGNQALANRLLILELGSSMLLIPKSLSGPLID